MKTLVKRALTLIMASLIVCTLVPTAGVSAQAAETATEAGSAVEATDGYYKNGTLYTGWEGKTYYQNGQKLTGWQTIGQQTYYFNPQTAKAVKGWQEIDKKYYYFDSKYRMQKNKIAGTKKQGYYYVGEDGVRINTKEMNQAVKFVLAHSDSSKSNKQRLKQCFNYLCKHYDYKCIIGDPKTSKIPSYARYMFKNKCGNCYRYASSFAYIARALGYDVRVCFGGVTSHANRALSPHGWAEVKIGKTWYICDASMHRASKRVSCYLKTMKKYPYRIRKDETHKMTVANGKVKWK